MIKSYYRPEEPTEPYFLLRAFDLGRIQEILRQLKDTAMDLTDIEEANEGTNRILKKANLITFILKEE